MNRNVFAWTAPGANYPEFVSINQQSDGTFTLDVRAPVQADGRCGETVSVALPVRQLAEMARALVCEVIPADLSP